MFSGAADHMNREEQELQLHLVWMEEEIQLNNQLRDGSGPRIYRHPDQVVAAAELQYQSPPRVHWADPIHISTRPTMENQREKCAIRRNTRANAIKVSDAELASRAEDNRVPLGVDQNARVHQFPANYLSKNIYMRVHGQSCKIKYLSTRNLVTRIEVDFMVGGYTLKVHQSWLIGMSFSPIPDGAITTSSAAMLVERDYTFLDGRPCMLTWVSARRALDGTRQMEVVGMDLETGERVEAKLLADTKVSIASRPVGEFVPDSLLGPGVATVPAASVAEGYHMMIEGRACRIVCVRYPKRPCKASCWRQVRVVGMDSLASTEEETVLRGIDLDMASKVTVGRNGIDPGTFNTTGGMSSDDHMFNNISF